MLNISYYANKQGWSFITAGRAQGLRSASRRPQLGSPSGVQRQLDMCTRLYVRCAVPGQHVCSCVTPMQHVMASHIFC